MFINCQLSIITVSVSERLRQMFESKAQANLEAGQQFLAQNAQREGVVSLPSGLQYEIITEGTGAKPTATQTVTCHYHGTLIDGRVFDSSVLRGKPASRELNGAMATVLLEMFEQSPERWEAVTWLNTSKSAPGETFGFYLEKWLRAAPPRHQLFIVEIKRAFGII